LREATLLQEVARRTGELDVLVRAASAARRAGNAARGERRLLAHAQVRHADIIALSATLFADVEALEAAAARLDEPGRSGDAVAAARSAALRGALLSRRSLLTANLDLEAGAVAALSAAAEALDDLARRGRVDPCEGRETRLELAELLIGSGRRAKTAARLEEALKVLGTAAAGLDLDYRPLTWCRLETLKAQALAALGDLDGRPELLWDGVAALRRVADEVDAQESPLDVARARHVLGLELQALGEIFDDASLFDAALLAFRPALEALEKVPQLPLRAYVAHDAADCLARRAERLRDLDALTRAEVVFLDELKIRPPSKDPLSWAVAQVALARIYAAQADLLDDEDRRRRATFALSSALEVFAEKGLRSLSEGAVAALHRLSPNARPKS
jgi:hypothetical protein